MDKEELYEIVLNTLKKNRIIGTAEITALAILGIPVAQIVKDSTDLDVFIRNIESAWSKLIAIRNKELEPHHLK